MDPDSVLHHADDDAPSTHSLIRVRSSAISLLLVLAIILVVAIGGPVLLPILAAVVFKIMLAPSVKLLRTIGVGSTVGAAVVVGAIVCVLGTAIYFLSSALLAWTDNIGTAARKLAAIIKHELGPSLRRVEEVTERVSEAAGGKQPVLQVEMHDNLSFLADALTSGQNALGYFVFISVLVYFLLAQDDALLRKFVQLLPRLRDKKAAVRSVREIEGGINRYLLTVTVINIILGMGVMVGLMLLGVEDAMFWGLLAFLLNFVPYIGPMIGITLLLGASLGSGDGAFAIFAPSALYLLLNAIEGMFVTPLILGSRMSLSPVAILCSLLFWGWIWGLPGALLAVPILAAIKITCDRVERWRAIGLFLGK